MASYPKCCSTLKSIWNSPKPYELLVCHATIVVAVVAEDILDDVVYFVGVLVEDFDESLLDLLLLEELVAVGVELNENVHHLVPHEVGEPVVSKLELVEIGRFDNVNPLDLVSHF